MNETSLHDTCWKTQTILPPIFDKPCPVTRFFRLPHLAKSFYTYIYEVGKRRESRYATNLASTYLQIMHFFRENI